MLKVLLGHLFFDLFLGTILLLALLLDKYQLLALKFGVFESLSPGLCFGLLFGKHLCLLLLFGFPLRLQSSLLLFFQSLLSFGCSALDLLNDIKERLNRAISIDNELATLILEGLVGDKHKLLNDHVAL